MPLAYWLAVLVSGAALALLLLLERGRRGRWLTVLTIVVAAGTLATGIHVWKLWRAASLTEIKGPGGAAGWVFVFVLYVAMVAGMVAQYFFFKSDRARFRWSRFLKPFFASPIVLLPLVGTLSEDDLSLLPFSLAKLMLLLVAFQNGFFWKTFFDSQARQPAPNEERRKDGG